MRCIACNVLLTDDEMKELNPSTGQPLDLCTGCRDAGDYDETQYDDFWREGVDNEDS